MSTPAREPIFRITDPIKFAAGLLRIAAIWYSLWTASHALDPWKALVRADQHGESASGYGGPASGVVSREEVLALNQGYCALCVGTALVLAFSGPPFFNKA